MTLIVGIHFGIKLRLDKYFFIRVNLIFIIHVLIYKGIIVLNLFECVQFIKRIKFLLLYKTLWVRFENLLNGNGSTACGVFMEFLR